MVTSSTQAAGGRTVVVTGASRGLGRGIALRLLRTGYQVVLADVSAEGLEETVGMARDVGTRASAVVTDLRDQKERLRLIAAAADLPGTLFGLVNNAGIARAEALFDESLTDWRDTMAINLEAAYFLAQSAAEHMRPHGEGRIINIASYYGFMGFDNRGYAARAPDTTPGDRGPVRQTAYAASKGGLIQITKDLAAAVGRWGITVNAVSPGTVPHFHGASPANVEPPTPASGKPGLGDRIDPDILEALAAQVPLGRVGRVEDIAGPVAFLLSDDASYITGVNLPVDGGWSIW